METKPNELTPKCYFLNNEQTWGYTNPKGEIVISPQFQVAKDFSMGLAPVKIEGMWGYINTDGKIVIPAQFYKAKLFNPEGVEEVQTTKRRHRNKTYVNLKGEVGEINELRKSLGTDKAADRRLEDYFTLYETVWISRPDGENKDFSLAYLVRKFKYTIEKVIYNEQTFYCITNKHNDTKFRSNVNKMVKEIGVKVLNFTIEYVKKMKDGIDGVYNLEDFLEFMDGCEYYNLNNLWGYGRTFKAEHLIGNSKEMYKKIVG